MKGAAGFPISGPDGSGPNQRLPHRGMADLAAGILGRVDGIGRILSQTADRVAAGRKRGDRKEDEADGGECLCSHGRVPYASTGGGTLMSLTERAQRKKV